MSKTHTFEELDKLTNGLKDISGLSDEEQKKTPERKKWRAAMDALPKKEKKEYLDRAYQKSREEKIEEDKQKEPKLKKIFEKEIRPNAKVIHFWLGKEIVKEERLSNEKEKITDVILGRNEEERDTVQNIGVPEIVDIDYSEVKNVIVSKNGSTLKPYRDGFLIVRDNNPKSYQHLELSDYTNNPEPEVLPDLVAYDQKVRSSFIH